MQDAHGSFASILGMVTAQGGSKPWRYQPGGHHKLQVLCSRYVESSAIVLDWEQTSFIQIFGMFILHNGYRILLFHVLQLFPSKMPFFEFVH